MTVEHEISKLRQGQVVDIRIRDDATWHGRPIELRGSTVRMAFDQVKVLLESVDPYTVADRDGRMRHQTTKVVIGRAIVEGVPEHVHVPKTHIENLGYSVEVRLIEVLEVVSE
jgi:hypothetical protein